MVVGLSSCSKKEDSLETTKQQQQIYIVGSWVFDKSEIIVDGEKQPKPETPSVSEDEFKCPKGFIEFTKSGKIFNTNYRPAINEKTNERECKEIEDYIGSYEVTKGNKIVAKFKDKEGNFKESQNDDIIKLTEKELVIKTTKIKPRRDENGELIEGKTEKVETILYFKRK